MIQLKFESILEQSFRQRQHAIDRYCEQHRAKYLDMGANIAPDLANWRAVWNRLAFAILSANAPFQRAVDALGYANKRRGSCDARHLARMGHTPAKADYLNQLTCGPALLTLCRQSDETSHTHRLRLRHDVQGLGLCKASFASALLEPLTADVACIDTHMQKVYLGNRGFKTLSLDTYLTTESKVRAVGVNHGISTFLAQWLIWDHVRGVVEPHAIFPGAHKLLERKGR